MVQITSLAQLMKSDKRLARNLEAAKNVQTNRNFVGPDGEYVCRFGGVSFAEKDGNPLVILRFKIDGSVDGQSAFNGASLDVIRGIQDSDWGKKEDEQSRLFADIQRLGVDTAGLEMADIDEVLGKMQGASVTIRAKTGGTGRQRSYIVGIANSSIPDYSSPETSDDTSDEWSDEEAESNDSSDDSDVWEEDAEAVEEATGDTNSDLYDPSVWVGYEVQWTPPKAKKARTCVVASADDEAGTVVLSMDGKVYGKPVPFNDIILPEAE